MALIELSDIAKGYRRGDEAISIFNNLSLSIEGGDFVAVMGPSGSGKTTLLNMLGGLDRPSAGTIRFNGSPIEKLSETSLSAWRAANIGFIFQFYNLMPTMTAAQNVELPLLLTKLGTSDRKKRVQTALDIVGLADLCVSPVAHVLLRTATDEHELISELTLLTTVSYGQDYNARCAFFTGTIDGSDVAGMIELGG